MLKPVLLSASLLALAACTLEDPAAGSSMGAAPGATVSRSFEAVSASLRQGAAQCLNGTFAASSMTTGGGMVSNSAWTVGLDTDVTTSGGQTQLVTRRTLLTGAIGAGPDNTGTWVTAVARPAGAGTALSVTGRWGSGAIQRAVRSWAQTGRITCPTIE